jgi:stalled ribosome alternative rescue factor ArfA
MRMRSRRWWVVWKLVRMRTRDGRWYELSLVKRMTLCLFREDIEIAKEALHSYVRKKKKEKWRRPSTWSRYVYNALTPLPLFDG